MQVKHLQDGSARRLSGIRSTCLAKLDEECFQAERCQRLHDHVNPRFEPGHAFRGVLAARSRGRVAIPSWLLPMRPRRRSDGAARSTSKRSYSFDAASPKITSAKLRSNSR